ncbi:MAG: ATP-grasp domain-containing protein [Candidatus Rokubacteria bacterium]|nr:ATP-grasp domain-containing protein [Candidatus Rokubacteria bacterium]
MARRRPRVLVLGAGGGPGNNLIHDLRMGDPALVVLGAHADRFALRKSAAVRSYLIWPAMHRGFLASLRRVIAREEVDLVLPTSDEHVRALARSQARIPSRLFLPTRASVALCQDKYALAARLRALGVPAPETYSVRRLAEVGGLFRRLGSPRRVWCRARTGSGSTGATVVRDAAQARWWMRYWADMRGVPVSSFILSTFLPGRDFGCQSLWLRGELVLSKAFERLAYVVGGSTPSGVSSVAALARTVDDPRLPELCRAAVRAVDGRASGLFSVDVKEDARGRPCVTEINAGRPLAGMPLLDRAGKYNMAVMWVRLALGAPVLLGEEHDAALGHYMVRDLDTAPGIYSCRQLLIGVRDVRR